MLSPHSTVSRPALLSVLSLSLVALIVVSCSKDNPVVAGTPAPTTPAHLTISSGDNQHVSVAHLLPNPMVVLLTDSANTPVPHKSIHFVVQAGNGQVLKPVGESSINELFAITGYDGTASAQFQFFGSDTTLPIVSATLTTDTTLSVQFHLLLP